MTEIVKLSMPETVEAFELAHRNQHGELADCLIEGTAVLRPGLRGRRRRVRNESRARSWVWPT